MASCPDLAVIDENSLAEKDWKVIGRGDFGQVFKVRHLQRGDVAFKLLGLYDGSSKRALDRESKLMRLAASTHVIQVLWVFKGRLPSVSGIQIGLVMELMARGSLASLQKELDHPLPWSLVFRVAHQVALGMQHLHGLKPDPIIHKDLKPGNVLLDTGLNVKIADFGISKLVNAVTSSGIKGAGTTSYMPPEAFSGTPATRAFDVYSYGILLWSIVKGKEPYDTNPAIKDLVLKGHRPSLVEVDPGLEELVKLMERCWHQEQDERPLFPKCTDVTGALYKEHESGIKNAVDQVVTELDQQESESIQQDAVDNLTSDETDARPAVPAVPAAMPGGDSGKTRGRSGKGADDDLTDEEKARFVIQRRADLIQRVSAVMPIVDSLGVMVHPENYGRIQAEKTRQDQMRMLYTRVLDSGGAAIKAAFYDALKKHQPSLLEPPEEHFVDHYRIELIQHVKMVSHILNLLLEEDVITREGYDNVMSKATTQEQIRELYTLLNSRKAKDMFYKALVKHKKSLLDDLIYSLPVRD